MVVWPDWIYRAVDELVCLREAMEKGGEAKRVGNMIKRREKRSYYYDFMTKDIQKEWLQEFNRSYHVKDNVSLETFLNRWSNDFQDFISGSFDWNATKRGIEWWEDYANTDESTILAWKRDETLKELGI